MRQFNNSPTGSRKHTHLNSNEGDVNRNEKHQIRPNFDSRNDYDITNSVTTSVNEGKIVIYTNNYNKCSCKEKSKCPLMNFCMTSYLVYKCAVHTNGGPCVYIGQAADSFKNRCRIHVTSFKGINKRHLMSLANLM